MKRNALDLTTSQGIIEAGSRVYEKMRASMTIPVLRINKTRPEFGPRLLNRAGPGMEFREPRVFNPQVDLPSARNARLSARSSQDMATVHEAETRQHFLFWRDPTKSMDYASDPALPSKRQTAEILIIALTRLLTKGEDVVGLLGARETYRGGNAVSALAQRLTNPVAITTNLPILNRAVPRDTSLVLFSDFNMKRDDLIRSLDSMRGSQLNGAMIMILDPQEIDFNFKGRIKFNDMEDSGAETLEKCQSLRTAYYERMRAHITETRKLCEAKGFQFILQRTDKPLSACLLTLYGAQIETLESQMEPKP